jgi:succinate dehydrogenase/fumarate reductase-like Fe-S protein
VRRIEAGDADHEEQGEKLEQARASAVGFVACIGCVICQRDTSSVSWNDDHHITIIMQCGEIDFAIRTGLP